MARRPISVSVVRKRMIRGIPVGFGPAVWDTCDCSTAGPGPFDCCVCVCVCVCVTPAQKITIEINDLRS
jgi:hypothetical protein